MAVPHEREEIGDLRRRHAPLLLDRRLVVHDALAGPRDRREHAHPRADELEHVLVRRHEHDLERQVARPIHQRAEDVVGLEARHLEERQPERLEQRLDVRRSGRRRSSGMLGPRLLVGGEALLAKRGTRRIPGDGGVLRVLLPEELPEHGGHAVDRVAGHALGGREVRQGVVGAVEIAGAVQRRRTARSRPAPRDRRARAPRRCAAGSPRGTPCARDSRGSSRGVPGWARPARACRRAARRTGAGPPRRGGGSGSARRARPRRLRAGGPRPSMAASARIVFARLIAGSPRAVEHLDRLGDELHVDQATAPELDVQPARASPCRAPSPSARAAPASP